ncbi:MAG TPA: trigger factor, partial [Fervidobacterium sp.]|nr:trigger factor [Thermotogaceae bacterium]HOH52791.1 trigger factor [Fervidobacterium sp.]HOL04306.1 trigger factor [Fervidobacterium sp.]HOV53493.1 trigger factor [Fervidobacterium sp.]HPV63341.1 trigger factor [Fervidobacterium sp.]
MEINEVSRDKNVVVREYILDANDVKRLENKTVDELNKKKYLIEGFRPGRVPKEAYKLRLRDDFYNIYVLDEAIEEVDAKLDEEKPNLVIPPVITDAQISADGGKITVEMHLEPEITLDTTKLKVKKAKEDEVLDGYVDMRTKYVVEEHAILEPKDDVAKEGDLVKVKETVLSGDKEIRKAEEKEYVLLADDERDVVKNLYGKKAGEVVEFEKTFEREGTTVVYKYILEVQQVYNRILPELNDEFVQSLSIENVETVDQLKDMFKSEGKQVYDKELADSYRMQIIDQLPSAVEIDLSDKTIQRAVEDIIDNLRKEGKYDEYIKNYGSEEKLVEDLKTYYINLLKKDLAVKKIAEENDIRVDDNDIKGYAASVSEEWGVSPDRAEALIKSRQDLRNEVIMEIVETKVAKVLAEKAEIEEVSFNNPSNENAQNSESAENQEKQENQGKQESENPDAE